MKLMVESVMVTAPSEKTPPPPWLVWFWLIKVLSMIMVPELASPPPGASSTPLPLTTESVTVRVTGMPLTTRTAPPPPALIE